MEKIISYTLGSEGIFPKESVLGGVQGEHRATAVEVTPDLELTRKIAEYTAEGKEIALKIEVAYLSGGLIYTEERQGDELFAPFYITGEMTSLGLDICIAVSILCDGSQELCKGLISLYFTPCPSANYISHPTEEGEIPYEDIAEELKRTAEHYDEVLSGKVSLAKSYTETSARHLKRVEELAEETEQTKATLENGMELRILSGGADAVLPAIPDGETGLLMRGVFGYREDTYQNWLDKNPVLMRGEPSIVRDRGDENWLKIGDGKTPWRDLPFLKGPKGEKGEKGEQGIQGEKGDDYLLTETDKEEIANKVKPWTLLSDIILTEAVSEIDGGMYDKKYDEIWVEGVITFETDYDATLKTGLFSVSPCVSTTTHTEYWGSIINGRTEFFRAHGYRSPSGCVVLDTVHGTSYYVGQNGKQTPGANKILVRQFNQFRLGVGEEGGRSGIRFGAGTSIKVWGR